MSIVQPPAPHQVVEAAIARVIDAERESRQAVADATTEAAAITEHARIAIHALEERTERRIGAIRVAFERHTAATIVALDQEGMDVSTERSLTDTDRGHVQAAVNVLARELTEG